MKTVLISLLAVLCLVGCSKRTISGVFEHRSEESRSGHLRSYDFRSDGTVKHKLHWVVVIGNSAPLSHDEQHTGTYKISGDEVVVTLQPEPNDTDVIIHILRIDGEDLILVSREGKDDPKRPRLIKKR